MSDYACDCYCYGACPGPLVIPGKMVLAEAACTREPQYELTFRAIEEPGRLTSSLFCAPCTLKARQVDQPVGEILTIRKIPQTG